MNSDIHVDPEHFAYLKLQKGSLDKYANDFPGWLWAYRKDVAETMGHIRPYLPGKCTRFLDIGSGLGGIDVLIRRRYEGDGGKPEVHLLDGLDDPPVMRLHRQTFNDMRCALNFQVKNGLNPLKFNGWGPKVDAFDEAFDLVVSFGSWCFHYEPDTYLPALVAGGLNPSTVVICDVRSNKPDWFAQLERVLVLHTMVHLKPKWSRCVFLVKPGALKHGC